MFYAVITKEEDRVIRLEKYPVHVLKAKTLLGAKKEVVILSKTIKFYLKFSKEEYTLKAIHILDENKKLICHKSAIYKVWVEN